MEITKDTKLSDILREYGDIAEVMEVFGIKRVGGYSFVRGRQTRAATGSVRNDDDQVSSQPGVEP